MSARKQNGPGKPYTVRLQPDEVEVLDWLIARHGKNAQDVIRSSIAVAANAEIAADRYLEGADLA